MRGFRTCVLVSFRVHSQLPVDGMSRVRQLDPKKNCRLVARATRDSARACRWPGRARQPQPGLRNQASARADVDEYLSSASQIKLKVFAPIDGCVADGVGIGNDKSVAIFPIAGGKVRGFVIADSSNPTDVKKAATCPPLV